MRTAAPILIPRRRVSQRSGRGRCRVLSTPAAPPSSQLRGDAWRPRSRRGHTDRASWGQGDQGGPRHRPPLLKGDLLTGSGAGVTSGQLHTDLPTEAPRDAALRHVNRSWSSTLPGIPAPLAETGARAECAASLSSLHLNPPLRAPIPFFGRGPCGGPGSRGGRGAGGRAPVASATLSPQV